jgi:hypothetical protein
MRATAVALATLAITGGALAAAVDPTNFRYERTLRSSGGLTAFEPDGPLYEHAALDLGDLRVLDSGGRQVPWRLSEVRGDKQLRTARVLNAGTEGGAAVALLDFGPERVVRTRIQLDVPLEPFVGRAEVSGSDDRRQFTRLSSTAIYDVRGATRAVSTAVVFPPSDFRYYRIRATGVSEIRGATAEAVVKAAEPVARDATITVRQQARHTLVEADLRYRRVWVHEVRFSSSTPAFDRPVEISGSNDRQAYFPAGGGRLYRFARSGETTVPLSSRYRYLRIRIANGDDPPLENLRVTLLASRDYVLLAPGFAPPYRVLYGGRVTRPEYDFAEQPEVPRQPEYAALGPERVNEEFEAAPDTRSYAERHPALIALALALAATMLLAGGFLAVRKRT